ncbi:MAG: hypothetical protein ACFFDT_22750, partial [Candidatus Hodarchaeota archaeon]
MNNNRPTNTSSNRILNTTCNTILTELIFHILLPSFIISECDLINQVNIGKVLIDKKMPYISDILL